MKTVLITGSSGFIGSKLAKRLRELKYNVYCLDLRGFRSKDIRRKHTFKSYENKHFDIIFHLAADVSIEKCQKNPLGCYENNVAGLINVLGLNCDKFVFASSAAVYDKTLNSHYAESKRIGENLVDNLANYSIVRIFNVYGPNQKTDNSPVIPSFIESYKKGSKITINSGEQTRDFIHVDDVVEGLILASNFKENCITDLGTGIETSINKLAEMIFGQDFSFTQSGKTGGTQSSCAYACRDNILNFSPKISLKQGLKELKRV